MKLNRSGEDYLKTILILEEQNGSVRSVDIAERLHFSKPSVSKAIRLLQEGGYLEMDPEKRLHLTVLGKTAAESVYEKHAVLVKALLAIGVTPETAERTPARSSTPSARRLFFRSRPFFPAGAACVIRHKG